MLYRKTAKGQAEIDTRVHRLTPRLRGLLILVDGKRDGVALASLVPQQYETLLADLLGGAFIEALPEPAPVPAPQASIAVPAVAAPVAPAVAAAATPAQAAAVVVAAASAANFDTLRRGAVRALTDELGPAADSLAVRMERTRNFDELRPLLTLAAQMVAAQRGRQAGEVYGMRFLSSWEAA